MRSFVGRFGLWRWGKPRVQPCSSVTSRGKTVLALEAPDEMTQVIATHPDHDFLDRKPRGQQELAGVFQSASLHVDRQRDAEVGFYETPEVRLGYPKVGRLSGHCPPLLWIVFQKADHFCNAVVHVLLAFDTMDADGA